MNYLKILFSIILFALLPLAVFTMVSSKTNLLGGVRSFTVLSGSMEPTISVGSIIYTVPQESYVLGDVITVSQEGNTPVTHRISQTTYENNEVVYQLKGDANQTVDSELIKDDEIIGKQVLAVPFLGFVSSSLKTPLGFGLLIVLPVLLLVGFEVHSIKKELEIQIEQKVRNELGMST